MSTHDRTFLSVNEFARSIGLSSRSVWRLVGQRDIPSMLIGRRRLIPAGEGIEALVRLSQREASRDPCEGDR